MTQPAHIARAPDSLADGLELPPHGPRPTKVATGRAGGIASIPQGDPESRNEAHAERMVIKVYGIPGPQGSKRFMGIKGGRGVMVESSKKVKPWREDVKAAAEIVRGLRAPLDCPLRLHMVFTLPKPASAPKRRQTWPMRTPDLSKLARSTEDALTAAGVWKDDARVVEYGLLAKRYPSEGRGALEAPGVWIEIEVMG